MVLRVLSSSISLTIGNMMCPLLLLQQWLSLLRIWSSSTGLILLYMNSSLPIASRFGIIRVPVEMGRSALGVQPLDHHHHLLPAFCSSQYLVDVMNEALKLKIQDPILWNRIQSRGVGLGSSRCKFTPTTICTAWMGVHDDDACSFLSSYKGLIRWLDDELAKDDNLYGLSTSTLYHLTNRSIAYHKWTLAEAAITRLIGKAGPLSDHQVVTLAQDVKKIQESISDSIVDSVHVLLKERMKDDNDCVIMDDNLRMRDSIMRHVSDHYSHYHFALYI